MLTRRAFRPTSASVRVVQSGKRSHQIAQIGNQYRTFFTTKDQIGSRGRRFGNR